MTEEELGEIEARAAAVPRGPWVVETSPRGYPQRITNAEALLLAECYTNPDYPPAVARFLAHAREDIPRLLAEVRRLQVLLADWFSERCICSAGGPTGEDIDEDPDCPRHGNDRPVAPWDGEAPY